MSRPKTNPTPLPAPYYYSKRSIHKWLVVQAWWHRIENNAFISSTTGLPAVQIWLLFKLCRGESMVLTVEWLRTTKGASKKVNFRKTIPSRTTWLSNYFLECPSGYWLQSSWLEKVHFSDDISMLGFFFWNITYFILKKVCPFLVKSFERRVIKILCVFLTWPSLRQTHNFRQLTRNQSSLHPPVKQGIMGWWSGKSGEKNRVWVFNMQTMSVRTEKHRESNHQVSEVCWGLSLSGNGK